MEGKIDSAYLLALNAHPKIGSQTLKKIVSPFSDGKTVWHADQAELKSKIGEKFADLVVEARHLTEPEKEIDRLKSLDIGFITIYDKKYPKLLKEIYDCPVILYLKGNSEALNSFSIAVVGSRKYSDYGRNVCYRLSKDCSSNGLTIVSGLALGIDTFAHQAAVDVGRPTIGVLGCGLDQIYPTSNNALAKEILHFNGAIISEFPPGTPPFKQNFPARNRIIAGLSSGVLVIEAAENSGALITAYQALEYNREVFAVPGNIDSLSSAGTNKLLKEGAVLVTSSDDIFSALNLNNLSKTGDQIDGPEGKEEIKICEILSRGDRTIDEIIKESELNVVLLSSTLTMLEMKCLVENIGSGRYHLKSFSLKNNLK